VWPWLELQSIYNTYLFPLIIKAAFCLDRSVIVFVVSIYSWLILSKDYVNIMTGALKLRSGQGMR